MATPTPPADHFTLLYFASATSYTHKSFDHLPGPLPVANLYSVLEKMYPGITAKVLSSSALTVNLEYVDVEEEALKGESCMVIEIGNEVAIIPPVSAG